MRNFCSDIRTYNKACWSINIPKSEYKKPHINYSNINNPLLNNYTSDCAKHCTCHTLVANRNGTNESGNLLREAKKNKAGRGEGGNAVEEKKRERERENRTNSRSADDAPSRYRDDASASYRGVNQP